MSLVQGGRVARNNRLCHCSQVGIVADLEVPAAVDVEEFVAASQGNGGTGGKVVGDHVYELGGQQHD